MVMKNFQCITPPLRLFQGENVLDTLGKELDRQGCSRALLVCGSSIARQEALLNAVKMALGARLVGIFSQVKAHSPLSSVMACADDLRRLGADAVVAVGGGSAIVTGRAASILLAEGRPAHELCTAADGKGGLKSPRLEAVKMPQFIVPTTPTTAMVKAGSAVFDALTSERLALFDPKTRAHAIFLHPAMVLSAPRALVVTAAVNSLSTAVEGLMSRTGNPIADALLMHAVRLLAAALAKPDSLDDAAVRADIVLAAILCGQGTDHTGAGITTVLGHALGARYDTENGTINAIVLRHVLNFNADHAASGFSKIATALGLEASAGQAQLIERLQTIMSALCLPTRLSDLAIPAQSLAEIAEAAMGDWFLRGNPRPVQGADDLLDILQKAW